MDTLSPEQRHKNMQHIKGADTKPELVFRKKLWHNGYRYLKNDKRLPGKPDIVLPKYRTVIFVNGCFWHRHPFCKYTSIPKTNTAFWEEKFARNVENDNKHYKELEDLGWHVIVVWECEIKKDFETTMKRVLNELDHNYLEKYISTEVENEELDDN